MSVWRRLVSEAHRRSLWQVLSVYLFGSWVGFQVVLGLVEGIGLPGWLPGFAAALFVIGLPVVLATAFVQEGMPGREAASATLDPTLFPGAGPDAVSTESISRDVSPKRRLVHVLTWRRSIAAGVVAFALLGGLTAGWLTLRALGVDGPWGSLLAASELHENDRVLIAEFEPRGGVDTTLAAVVTDAFRLDFGRSTLLRPVEPAELRAVLERMGYGELPRVDAAVAQQVAERDGIPVYVLGEVATLGSSYAVTARLIGTATGEVLASMRERADDEDELIEAVDRMSRQLRERTGESLRTVQRAEALADVTTSSLEALRYFTQGLRASSWHGDHGRARELYERALQLDTTFASAHRALAVHHMNSGRVETALDHAERALQFSGRLTPAERAATESTYHLTRWEYADAAEALERVIALKPTRPGGALTNLAMAYTGMGDTARAGEFYRRAVQADTMMYGTWANLGEHLVTVRRYDEAEQAYAGGIRRAPSAPWVVVGLAQVPYLAGDPGEAEARLGALLDDPKQPLNVQGQAAGRLLLIALAGGRYREADDLGRRFNAASGSADDRFYLEFDRALIDVYVRGQATPASIEPMKQAARNVTSSFALIDAAVVCGLVNDLACARDLLARAGRDGVLQPWSRPNLFFAHAMLARATGDLDGALSTLRDIRDLNCHACAQPLVGLVFESMNQPDSAAAAYERYVNASYMDRIETDVVLAPLHEWLGGYYEDRGDRQRAMQHYARVTEIWKDADAELQPRVAAARAHMERLGADR